MGKTLVSSQIRRFSSATESSPQTRTVYSLPLHLTVSVSSSDELAVEEDEEDAMCVTVQMKPKVLARTLHALFSNIYNLHIMELATNQNVAAHDLPLIFRTIIIFFWLRLI